MTSSEIPYLGARYDYLREVGRGGVARVLLVRDKHLERDVALKLLLEIPEDRSDLEALQREFELLTQLRHPAIARAYDFGYLGELPYFTCEFVPGTPLADAVVRHGDSFLYSGGRELAEALAFLHDSGVVHLDVKPSNLIARPPTDGGRLVLIDFGVFRRAVHICSADRIRGSLPFMAPEYFQNMPIGPWTDVYAFGVTWYWLATGRFPRPVPPIDVQRLSSRTSWVPAPELPSRLRPSLTSDFDSIILKCLALDPRSRFSSGAELVDAFGAVSRKRAVPGSQAPTALQTVGRDAELATVDRFLGCFLRGPECPEERLREGLVALLLTGPPGAGLTHLFRELKVRAQTRGIRLFLETGFAGRTALPGALLRGLGAYASPEARSGWERFLQRLKRPRAALRHETTEGERRLRWAGEFVRVLKTIQEPTLIAVDDLHFFDEVSVALVSDLVRILTGWEGGDRPPVGVVVGYREEGPCAPLLRDLSNTLLSTDRVVVISPGHLGPTETLRLYHLAGGADANGIGGLSVFQKTGGNPSSIVETAAPHGRPSDGREETESIASAAFHALGKEQRLVLVVLVLRQSPASTAQLARFSRLTRAHVQGCVRELRSFGLVQETSDDQGRTRWLPASAVRRLAGGETIAGMPPIRSRERRCIHSRIGRELAASASGADDPRLREAIHHFLKAGARRAIVKYGRPVAGYLKSTFQNRAALQLLDRVFHAIADSRAATRLEVARDLADLHKRVGSVDDGIRLLRRELPTARRVSRTWEARVQLHLATLHSTRGDFQRADSLFQEGLARVEGGDVRLGREELLFFLTEFADTKAFLGAYEAALELCSRGLELAGKTRRVCIRELVLNLHATRANIALRQFDFEGATSESHKALEIAEAIGSVANQATILNNLGIVYAHADRYREAIRTFREAERTCLQLDEGPSLSFVRGNLGVLYAKMGDVAASREALGSADATCAREVCSALDTAGGGKPAHRQILFLEHHKGLASLFRGRYRDARPHFESAIRFGDAVGDRLVASFDAVYRCECLIFEARYREAARELARLVDDAGNPQLRRTALSLQALLEAMLGSPGDLDETLGKIEEIDPSRRVAFLETRDALFLGWALSIAGRGPEAREKLGESEAYFRGTEHTPGATLAAWIAAESFLLEGDMQSARHALDDIEGEGSALTNGLVPLLRARIYLECPTTESAPGASADLLAEAGAAMADNPLPEYQLRLAALRNCLCESREGDERESTKLSRARQKLVVGMPRATRRKYLASRYWDAWTKLPGPLRPGAGEAPIELPGAASGRPATTTQTVLLRSSSAGLRSMLVARSPGMRRLCEDLDRLLELEMPVVIQGESGTGKELVARIIHAESRRYSCPFQVIDCATIPPPLLDTELFGAVAGAFTDLSTDRSGLLASAEGGTILIDNIVGLPPEVQAKLLRVISEKTFRPVGADAPRSVDARFLFTATRDLENEVREQRLRRDFLERVQALRVVVPPLRERPEDIPDLLRAMLENMGKPVPSVESSVYEWLRRQPFPGNVRELQNLLCRLRFENPERITLASLEASASPCARPPLLPRRYLQTESLPDLKNRLEREYILNHLEEHDGDTQKVSELLGVSRKHFQRRCRQLGIPLRKRTMRRSSRHGGRHPPETHG